MDRHLPVGPEPSGSSAKLSHRPKSMAVAVPWVLAVAFLIVVFSGIYSYRQTARFAARAGAPARHPVTSLEAQDFYLKGQFYWSKRTPESLNLAVDSFTQAVVRDPGYAQAYVGLAESYNLLREFSVMPATEAYPRALAAERRAVALDDSSSAAHTDLAFTTLYWNWDWPVAEREFKRAIALDPTNARAHHWYATALLAARRFPEALVQIERAQKLDPSSTAILADKGLILYYSGQHEAGIELLRQIEKAEPSFAAPHRYLADVMSDAGHYNESLPERKEMDVELRNDADLSVANAAEQGLEAAGTRGMFESMLPVQERLYPKGSVSPYTLARTCAHLGREDDAIRYLRDAYEQRDVDFLVNLKDDHAFDVLRGQPAFQKLQAKINVPRPD